MKFGTIKSKIEKILTESYLDETFKDQMFVFDQLVLKNKNIKKLYFLYDELSSNKGLEKNLAENFINECTIVFENTVNKITKNQLKDLELWTSGVKVKNNYEDIDNLFTSNVALLENKLKSKNLISENLQKKSEENLEINTTLDNLVDVGNKTINNYLSNLTESEKLKIKNILKESDEKLKLKFDLLKETIIEKLTDVKENENDKEVLEKINLTITKVQNENFDKLNYLKLKDLEKGL
jgi:hypothetical protein